MTRFEKDYRTIKADALDAREILRRRKAEIDKLTSEGKKCKNSFRMQCIAQDVARFKREYDALDDLI